VQRLYPSARSAPDGAKEDHPLSGLAKDLFQISSNSKGKVKQVGGVDIIYCKLSKNEHG
jgi:hypothetical protein